jgi:hypothetical protein
VTCRTLPEFIATSAWPAAGPATGALPQCRFYAVRPGRIRIWRRRRLFQPEAGVNWGPALGGRLLANAAVDRRRLLRSDGARPAGAGALECGARRPAIGGDQRQRHAAQHAGERASGWLRRAPAAGGFQTGPYVYHGDPRCACACAADEISWYHQFGQSPLMP